MKIYIAELEKIVGLLFEHIKADEHEWVEITDDFYWDIPGEKRYDPYNEPQDYNLGQLTDNWNELSNILHGRIEPINYALVWLAAILRKIGEDLPG